MSRAVLGLIKGLLIGGAASGVLIRVGSDISILAYVSCILVGLLVGLACGRAPWRAETIWTPVLKMVVGAVFGAGLCYLGRRFLPGVSIPGSAIPSPVQGLLAIKDTKLVLHAAALVAPAIGVLYGVFVELDDGAAKEGSARAKR